MNSAGSAAPALFSPTASARPPGWGRQGCRLDKCDSEQARAKQRKAGNGHSEETVRSKFFTHGTPAVLEKPGHQSLRLCANRTTAALHSQKYFDGFGKLESD